ncbi:MAG TPA: metal-dependent transcriptional regulator [Limnochordia bacterium]|nr:metal-dependent transcriptional regulator [Limnochordia bacterium]
MRSPLSSQAEDYLKAIYHLTRPADDLETAERATTQALSERMGVSAASVSGMLKKLADLNLIQHRPYYGATLTADGEAIALEIIRHHRLLETYLAHALGYEWDELHEEADRLEHVISEEFEDRISALLGDPDFDPHGHPIPARDGSLPERVGRSLDTFAGGDALVVNSVSSQDPELLRYLDSVGIRPGEHLDVVRIAPFDGPVTVQTARGETALGRNTAGRITASPRSADA